MRPVLPLFIIVLSRLVCFSQVHPGFEDHPSGFLKNSLSTIDVLSFILFGGLALLMVAGVVFVTYRNRQKAKEVQLLASKDREIAMQREQLYVNVTHELRTPLTLIISPLERLAETNPHPDVLTALHHARELLHRFNDILKWNKLEANAMTLTNGVGNLTEEVRKMVTRMRSIADSKQVGLIFKAQQEEIWCEMDFEKLDTILSNLLMNAVKYTDTGGKIQVIADFLQLNQKNFLQLAVVDNGRGIPAEALSVIFERFGQAGQAGTITGGAGIGLALVKRLTALMGGQIEAYSQPGVETRFAVLLPYRPVQLLMEHQTSTLASDSRTDDVETSDAEKTLLLLVEDNLDLQSFMLSSLRPVYDLLYCVSVEEALHLAKENLPEIIITDIMLQGEKDGIDLCHALKSDPLTNHIPVLILTARTSFETKQRALEAGVDVYLTKPFSVRELELSLENLLENRRALRERFKTTLKLEWQSEKPNDSSVDPYLELVLDHIRQQLDNPKFGIEQLAQAMKISRVQLFKKVKSLTGLPPADLLRTIRLEKAMHLLKTGTGNVSEVAYQVGFDNPNYFSKAFRKHFGMTPSEV
jgi:signal transduction histidine kinase/DNA-binding response OmpR family regulator